MHVGPDDSGPGTATSEDRAGPTGETAAQALGEIAAAADRIVAKFDERSRVVLTARILSLDPKPTLQELGSRFGLTRERIRQIEDKTTTKIRFRLAQRENRPLREAGARLREQLGAVIEAERLDGLKQMFEACEIARERPFLLPLLLWEAGPYERHANFIVRAPAEKVVSATLKVLKMLTRRGPAEASAARGELSRLGLTKEVQEPWVSELGCFRFSGAHLVPWDGNLGDKAEAILTLRKQPMTQEDISAEIPEEHNPRTLGNRLVGDSRFCRTDPDHFALKAWGLPEYSSIVDQLVEEISLKGGEAKPEYLIETLTSKFGVSQSSVRSYLGSPRFARTAWGTIRVRMEGESFTVDKKVELTRRCYRLSRGWAHRVTIDGELLRGSGRPLPGPFAVELGLAPLKSVDVPSSYGKIHASWPAQQATIGSLRRIAETLGGKAGDYLFIESLPKPKLRFLLIKREDVERATGLQRLQIEVGCTAAVDGKIALRRIASALGLDHADASLAAIRRRLQARAEDDLASLLPPETGAEHQEALQELLDLVGS